MPRSCGHATQIHGAARVDTRGDDRHHRPRRAREGHCFHRRRSSRLTGIAVPARSAQALLAWLRCHAGQRCDVRVADARSGEALLALLERLDAHRFPYKPREPAHRNLSYALQQLEEHFGVPAINPSDPITSDSLLVSYLIHVMRATDPGKGSAMTAEAFPGFEEQALQFVQLSRTTSPAFRSTISNAACTTARRFSRSCTCWFRASASSIPQRMRQQPDVWRLHERERPGHPDSSGP